MTQEEITQQAEENERALNLEIFLKRAFRNIKGIKRTPEPRELLNLIDVEKGGSPKDQGTREKQIEEIKKRLLIAFEFFLSSELDDQERLDLTNLMNEVQYLNSSYSISLLAENGIRYTDKKFRN